MAILWLFSVVGFLTWMQCYAAAPWDKEKCMKDLGCFEIGGDFIHPTLRPFPITMDDEEVINPTPMLYTRENPRIPRYLNRLNKASITESTFKSTRPTKIIIHGFMDTQLFGNWMRDTKDQLLILGDLNVIIMDWSGGNKPPYAQATSNTRVVGAYLALLLSIMQEVGGLNLADVHLIGHSLGAHISGYTGKRLKSVGRITALDPAEPYFQGLPKTVRLDREDATFVDVIHTDSKSILFLGFGMSQSIGHLDFFPNEGKDQPGCKSDQYTKFITNGLGEGIRRFVSCNHQRSCDFMQDTINHHECNIVAYACNSWEDYMDAKCTDCGPDGSKCAIMGLKADHYLPLKKDNQSVNMYTSTGSASPYCLFHYRVSVQLYRGQGKYKDTKGTISVKLIGAYSTLEKELSSSKDFYHGAKYNFIITTDYELGPLKQLRFSWKYGPSLNPLDLLKTHELYVEKVEVASMNYIDKETRDKLSKVFCHAPEQAIVSKKETVFTDC